MIVTISGFPGCTETTRNSRSNHSKVIITIALLALFAATSWAQSVQLSARQLLQQPHPASTTFVAAPGAEKAAAALASNSARPLSLRAGDVFGRGQDDVISGFATPNGGAIVIQSAKIVRGAGESLSPFQEQATVIDVPVAPDFIAVVDANNDGRADIVFGSRGDSRIFVMTGKWPGGFNKAASVTLPGALNVLESDAIGTGARKQYVLAGVRTQNGGTVSVLKSSIFGLQVTNNLALPAVPSSIAVGAIDATPTRDLAAVAGGHVYVFHGDDVVSGRAAHAESVAVNGTATGVAMGTFLPHRGARNQMAVLMTSGDVSVLMRGTPQFTPYSTQELRNRRQAMRINRGAGAIDEPGLARNAAHNGHWTVIETSSTGVSDNSSIMKTRTSGNSGDDITVISADQARLVTISHAASKTNLAPAGTLAQSNLYSATNAVIPMRTGASARTGFVMLSQSSAQPMSVLPATQTSIVVDTTADTDDAAPGDNNCDDGTGKCSLRAAIEEANARNLGDTIVIPDGSYFLGLGQIDITAGMTIAGQSGNASAVNIDGSGIGKIFSINPSLGPGFDVSISGVTITDGSTTADIGLGGDGAGLDWDAGGTGNLHLSNVVILGNISQNAGGGALFLTNTIGGTGTATVTNSTITQNLASDIGGGVLVGNQTTAIFNNVTMDDDHADNTAGGTGIAQGGGYFFIGPSGTTTSAIHGGSITNCTAIGDGGAINSQVGLVIDAGTAATMLIQNNSSGGNGGAIFQSAISEDSLFTNLTITGNTAGGDGGGIYENATLAGTPSNIVLQWNRIVNNSSGGGTGNGLFNAASGAVINGVENWWACNVDPKTPACNAISDAPGTVTASPWLVLRHRGAPNPIALGPAADVTLTADFLSDSLGGSVGPANIPALLGIPIAFDNAVNGTLSNAQTSIQPNGTATATLTVTAGPTASADATVDGLAVPVAITVQTADVAITKTHSGSFQQGQTGAQYTITVGNHGAAGTFGTVTVTDTLPAGLTATAISGTGWTCTLGTLTCTRSDVLAAGAFYPAITVTVDVASSAPALVTNTATVAGGGDTANLADNTASDSTTILPGADLTITKAHTGNFTQGQTGAAYTITVSNSGGAPTTGTVTVVDALPVGMTATAIAGTGWTCTLGTLTCTRSDALAAASSYPAITLTVNVAANAGATLTNNATVSGGGEVNPGNDTASDLTTINQAPDLTVTKSHVGNFSQGQTGATYSITVSNVGGSATSAAVTVIDTLPAGLTATAISGTGWTCTLGTLTCTRADALAATSAYPGITLTVNVATNAAASITNSVVVSGGGEVNAANDTATDVTTVIQLADLTLTKTHTGNFFRGQNGATYTLTVRNSGTGASSGTVTLTDTLPADLTATAMAGTGWTCTVGTLTCTRADALNPATSYPAVTLTVNVSATAAATVTNNAAVSGGSDSNNANNSASDATTIVAPFTLTVSNPNVTVTPGQRAVFNMTLAYPTGASGTVSLACGSLPPGAACNFAPAQATMTSGGSTPVVLGIDTKFPATSGTLLGHNAKSSGALLAFAMFPAFGMVMLVGGRRKWLVRIALLAILVVVAVGFVGCGVDAAPGQFVTPGTYNIAITATTNTNQQATATVQLTVVQQ